jgi:hypothetical protein
VEVIPWPTTLDVGEQPAPVFATFAAVKEIA